METCDLCEKPLDDEIRRVLVQAMDNGKVYKEWWNDYHPACYLRLIEHEASLLADLQAGVMST